MELTLQWASGRSADINEREGIPTQGYVTRHYIYSVVGEVTGIRTQSEMESPWQELVSHEAGMNFASQACTRGRYGVVRGVK